MAQNFTAQQIARSRGDIHEVSDTETGMSLFPPADRTLSEAIPFWDDWLPTSLSRHADDQD